MSALAQAVGVSESYISLLESGDRQQPARELVLKIAHELGARSYNNLADDFLVTAGYYPTHKQVYDTHSDTLAAHRRAWQRDPENFAAYSALIFALIKTGAATEAEALIQTGLQQFQELSQLQSLLASLELSRGQFDKALKLQSFALEQVPPDQPAERERCELNLGIMHFLKARALLEHNESASEPVPELTPARPDLLRAYECLQTVLQGNPHHLYALDEYARVCFNLAALGDPEQPETQAFWQTSIASLEKVLQAEHKYILGHQALLEAAVFLAHAHSKTHHFSAAETLFGVLEIALSPPHWLVAYAQACCYSLRAAAQGNSGDLHRALNYLKMAHELNPTAVRAQASRDPDLAPLREQQSSQFQEVLT